MQTSAMGRKQPVSVPDPVGGVKMLSVQDKVGRSYFDILAGQSQLFSENRRIY